jgi:hypothetical protein
MHLENALSRIWVVVMLAFLLGTPGFAVCAQTSAAAKTASDQAMPAMQSVQPPTWGLHGMVLFGGADGLFASHLPMFHAPHDYHVVIALQLASPAIDAAMRTRLAESPELWTLVPEKFELARLAPGAANPLTTFKADIVEGHFERGGKTIYSNLIVRVIRTERFVQLDPHARPAATARYLPIGQGRTWFLVKEVHARPDFDHVVMLSSTRKPGAIDVQVNGIVRPADAMLKAMLPMHTTVVGTVYYDTEDLQ